MNTPAPDLADSELPTNVVTRSDLLALIDSELDGVQRASATSGWTVWAIVAALATCVWMAIDIVAAGTVSGASTAGMLVAAHFALTAAFAARIAATPSGTATETESRVTSTDKELASSRLKFVLIAAQCCACAYWLAQSLDGIAFAVRLGGFLSLSFALFASVLALAMSMIRAPLPKRRRFERGFLARLIELGFMAINGAVAIGIALEVLHATHPAFDDLRLALLLSAVWLLLVRLLDTTRDDTHYDELVRIRRDLLLGAVTTEAAKQYLSAALLGITREEHEAPTMAELRHHTARFERELDSVRTMRELALQSLEGQPDPLGVEKEHLVEGLILGLTQHLVVASEIAYGRVATLTMALVRQAGVFAVPSRRSAERARMQAIVRSEYAARAKAFNVLVEETFSVFVAAGRKDLADGMIATLNATEGLHFDPATGRAGGSSGLVGRLRQGLLLLRIFLGRVSVDQRG